MSKVSKTKIASALIGALAVAGSSIASASELSTAQAAASKIHKASTASQTKIDKYYDAAQDKQTQYVTTEDQRESLKAYNDYVLTQVEDQEREMALIQADIDYVDTLRTQVVPLMFKMVDTLEQFVALDLPFNLEKREGRVANLRETIGTASVPLAEKFRLILDAYDIENDYGRFVAAYEGKLNVDGSEVLVDYFRLGRVALYAQSQDQKQAWMYNKETKAWEALDESYLRELTKGIRIARKQGANDLFSLPVPAAEKAQ